MYFKTAWLDQDATQMVEPCSVRESTWISNYSCEYTLVCSAQQYLLLCPLARKREDMLSLGTLLDSAVDRHWALEK